MPAAIPMPLSPTRNALPFAPPRIMLSSVPNTPPSVIAPTLSRPDQYCSRVAAQWLVRVLCLPALHLPTMQTPAGGPSRISLWNNTLYKAVQNPATVGTYVYQGCYAEGSGGRALANASWSSSSVTIESCVNYCKGQGVLGKWAGVEYGQECYCGSGVANGGGPAKDGNVGCNMACAGNQYEWCGGPNRLNVYKSS